jgi:hypothetical protein
MGQRLIITEEERIQILKQHKLLNEGVIETLVSKLSGTKLYQAVDKAWDKNPAVFVQNFVKQMPKFKDKSQELLQKIKEVSNMNDNQKLSFINKYKNSAVQDVNVLDKNMNEQILAGIYLGIILIVLIYIIIGIIKSGKQKDIKEVPPTEPTTPVKIKSEIDKQLEVFNKKTINLYNDLDEQIIYGRDIIFNPKFIDVSTEGGRSGVIFGFGQGLPSDLKDYLGDYEIPCLSNPDRLASFIVRKGKYDIQSRKYNKRFTDELSKIASPFCKKPDADFGLRQTSNNDNVV